MIVTTTVTEEADARRLADLLIERRLAACVQVAAITSTYRWAGAARTAPEIRLDAKTTAARAGEAMAALRAAHPYDEPELIAVPVARASDGYAAWVREETRRTD